MNSFYLVLFSKKLNFITSAFKYSDSNVAIQKNWLSGFYINFECLARPKCCQYKVVIITVTVNRGLKDQFVQIWSNDVHL